MKEKALDRDALRNEWAKALSVCKDGLMVEEVAVSG